MRRLPKVFGLTGRDVSSRLIASHLRIALIDLKSARKLGFEDRNAAQLLFQATENLTMAVLSSEIINVSELRRRVGNHQLYAMICELPEECAVKEALMELAILEGYATTYRYPSPSGSIPKKPDLHLSQKLYDNIYSLTEKLFRHFRVSTKDEQSGAENVSPIR